MSVATLRSVQTLHRLMPVLTPLYDVQQEPFCALADGTYRCGAGTESEFCLEFSGAESAHCTFERQGGAFFVQRNEGRVWINDLPVRGRIQLVDGDVISLGPVSFLLTFEEAALHQPPAQFQSPVTASALHSPGLLAAKSPICDTTHADATLLRDSSAARCAPVAQEYPRQVEVSRELEEQQKLLSLRQQQLDDLLHTVRDREQNAESRLTAIEERSLQISAQWNELLQKKQELVVHEGELVRYSQDVQRQLSVLAERQQRSIATAEESRRSGEAVEQARQELMIREQTLAQRENAFSEAERRSAARAAAAATSAAETHSVEQMTAFAAQREAAVRERQLAVEAQAALRQMQEELDRRLAALAATEVQISETQHAATAIVQAAESERRVLQSASKDLLCERNSLSQLRQDLASREGGISEREVLVAHQLEEMRSRFTVLDQRAAELKHRESEIDTRAAVVHRRIQQFKADQQAHTETTPHPVNAPIAAAGNDEALTAVRQQLEVLQQTHAAQTDERTLLVSEREALLSAVRELQKALQDARQDVEDANRVKSQAALQQERLEQAWQAIEKHTGSLQLSESRLMQVSGQVAELQETLQTRDAEIQRLAEDMKSSAATAASTPDADARQVDGLKLAQVRLQGQLESAEEFIRQRDGLICELRDRLMQRGSASPMTTDSESFNLHSRELDDRAEVLDRRDEEMRERSRKIDQSEADVESQRRELLQARQQLELARAEIQLAMRQQSEPGPRAVAAAPHAEFATSTPNARHPGRDSATAADEFGRHEKAGPGEEAQDHHTDLRSELAGLFGVRKPTAEYFSPPPLPRAESEFVDLSEPCGGQQGIELHFGINAAQIVETGPGASGEIEPEPVREENSDDFVRSYMEQLLSRSRKSAGNALPGELKVPEKKIQPAAAPAEKPAVKSGPRVISFIEQYMAGNMGNLDSGESLSMTNPAAEEITVAIVAEEQPAQHRQKMDLQKLKENMDSFRALSTQSVEKALASHAMKVQRDGVSGRISFAVVLIAVTLVLGIANVYGAIESPMLTWVTLTAAIGIVSELLRRYSVVSGQVQSPSELQQLTGESSAQASRRNDTNAANPSSDDKIIAYEER